MKNILILGKVELLEAVRSVKVLWLAVFFSMLGVTQPLIEKYMKTIIENFGGIEGITIDPNTPVPQSNEVLLATFAGQFNQIGLIVLIISFMGMISADKNSGVQDFIFTKPVSQTEYIISKLFGNWIVSMVCIFAGTMVAYVYTIYLFGYYSVLHFLIFLLFYSVWILFVVSTVVLFSSFIKNSIFVGISTIVVAILFIVLGNINEMISLFLPSGALTLAENQLLQDSHSNLLWLVAPILFIVINLYMSKILIKKI